MELISSLLAIFSRIFYKLNLFNYIIYIMKEKCIVWKWFQTGGGAKSLAKNVASTSYKKYAILHTRNKGTKNDIISCGCPRIIYFRVSCCLLHISPNNLFLYFLLLKPLDTLLFMKRYFLRNAIFIYFIGKKEVGLKKVGLIFRRLNFSHRSKIYLKRKYVLMFPHSRPEIK